MAFSPLELSLPFYVCLFSVASSVAESGGRRFHRDVHVRDVSKTGGLGSSVLHGRVELVGCYRRIRGTAISIGAMNLFGFG